MPTSPDILSVANADISFLRAQEVLKNEGLDPDVTMEFCPSAEGILCGLVEAIELARGLGADGIEIEALVEGALMRPNEPVLHVRGRYQAFGGYETALLGIMAPQSGWASAAREIVAAAQPIPVIAYGPSSLYPGVSARMEYAATIGGCDARTTRASSELPGRAAFGTMPQALMLIMGDTVSAAQAFDRWITPDVERIAVVDTFNDEAEEAVRVALALGDRLWGVRLNSGERMGGGSPQLIKRVREQLDLAGFPRVKILVSGGITRQRIEEFKRALAPIDAYGVGRAITGAAPIGFVADIVEVNGTPTASRGRAPGIRHAPRLRKLES